MSDKILIETVTIGGKRYIDIAALSLHLREMSLLESNVEIKNYMNHISDELLRMIVNNEKKN